jgi:uncharacterized repeat protein (TIGR01451 family)
LKTTHTHTYSLRRTLLSATALIILAVLLGWAAPLTQVVASRVGLQPATVGAKARQLAANILTYAPPSWRANVSPQPLPEPVAAISAAHSTPYVAAASLLTAFTKTAAPAGGSTIAAGGTITYTVTATNNDLFDDLGVLLTDATPANTTFVSLSISQQPTSGPNWICAAPVAGSTGAITCQPTDGNRTFLDGSAGTGQVFQVQYTVQVNPTLAAGATITSAPAHYTALAGDFNTFGGPVDLFSDNNTPVTHDVVHSLDLQIEKSDSPDAVFAGNNISYTLTVRNNGPSQAASGEVRVIDAVPTNTTPVSVTGTGAFATCNAAALNGAGCLNTAVMNAGETATITFVVTVNAGTPNGFINNTAQVATVGALVSDPNQTNNASTTNTGVGPNADLQLTKTASAGPVVAGSGTITYTINITNTGPSNANGVVVTDNLPANTTLSAGPTWTPGNGVPAGSCAVSAGGTITCGPTAPSGVLTVGQTATITYTVTVGANVAAGTLITNTANIASTGANATPDPNVANNLQGPTSTLVNTSADLSITKSTSSPTVTAGGPTFTYTLVVTNAGPSDAQNVIVNDPLPLGIGFVSVQQTVGSGFSCTGPPANQNGTVTCTKGTMATGESATFVITALAPANSAAAARTNTATVQSATTDPAPNNNSAVVGTTIVTEAIVSITKIDNPDPVIAGNNLTYTITVSNAGPSVAQAVTLTDPIPANTTFVSLAGTGILANCAHNAGNVSCLPAPLPPGESASLTLVVNVNPNTLPGVGAISNTANVTWTDSDSNPGSQNAIQTTTVNKQTDISVTKTDAPHAVLAGNQITYTIKVKNNGPSTAAIGGVSLTDATPTNTTDVSLSGTGAFAACTLAALHGAGCTNATAMAPNEEATLTYIVSVNPGTPIGFISNTATVAAIPANLDPNLTNNSTTIQTAVGPNADLQLTKSSAPPSVTAGGPAPGSGQITYSLTYKNNGPSDAVGVQITDTIAANLVAVGAISAPGLSCDGFVPAPGVQFLCTPNANAFGPNAAGVLPVGATGTLSYNVRVPANVPQGTLIANAATITSTAAGATPATPDPNSSNNSQNATSTLVNTSADLAITKTDSPDPVIAGNNLTYTIVVTNNGVSDAQNIVVSDTLPALLTFVSVSSTDPGFACTAPPVGSGGLITCNKATLPAGASATLTLIGKVNPNTVSGATITNTATVASSTNDPGPSANSATTTTTVNTSTTLSISKSDAPDPVVAGTNLTFTVTVANNGPSDAQNVVMTDPLPTNTSFVSVSGTGVFSNAGACTHNGAIPGIVTCNALPGGVLPAGATATATIVVKVASSAPVSPPFIVNTATVTSPTDPGSPRTATSSTTVRREADMTLEKKAPSTVIAGQNMDYTLTVKNEGPSDVAGGAAPGTIVVTDNLPVGTSFISAFITGPGNFTCTANAQLVTCLNAAGAAGDFPKGSVVTIVLKVMAAKNLANNSNLNNAAQVALTGPEVDPLPGNNSGAASTVVHTSADLAIIKDVLNPVPPAGVVAGENITYRLRVINNGPSNAQSVTVYDILPGNTTFEVGSLTGTGVFAGNACTYNPAGGTNGSITCIPNASPGPPPTVQGEFTCGVEETITYQVKVNASVSGGAIIPNPAQISSASTPDPNAGNNTSLPTSTVVIARSNLSISKTVFSSTPAVDPLAPAGAVIPGTQLTYRIRVTNNGPSDVINVLVADTLPANAKFVAANRSGGLGTSLTCAPPAGIIDPNGYGGIVNCTAPLLSSNTTATPGDPAGTQNVVLIDLTVFIDPSTKVSLVNNAVVSATTNNFNQPVSATTSLTTPVSPTSDLVVTKTHTVDDTVALTNTAGNTFTYTITVKNNGQSTAAMVSVVDTLPAGQTLAGAPDVSQAAGLSCTPNTIGSGGVITCTGGTLLPNATAVIKLLVKIDPCLAPGIYNNTVTATSMSFDPTPANATVVDPVTVVARPDLAITKTAAATVIAGNTLTYTIEATNNGPSCALDVMITDPLPPNTVLVSAVPSAGGVLDASSPAVGANGTVKATWAGLTSPGVKRTLTIIIRVGANVLCDTVLTNTATVSYTARIPNPNPNQAIVWDVDPVASNNTATATTTVQAQSDLNINKTGPAQANFSTQASTSTVTYTLTFANAGPSNSAGTMVVDTLPKGFTVVGQPTSTVPGTTFTITTTNGVTTVKANLGVLGAANQVGTNFPTSGTITIVAKVPDKHPLITVTNVATISTMNCLPDPNLADNTSSWDTLITMPGTLPGVGYPARAETSDQKGGSILFFPIYTSDASNPNSQNARVSITNTSDADQICVHLFVVDGSSCAVLDAFLCLTPNQTTSFLASDFDPGNTGYMMAVAVDCMTGLPAAFNCLIGDEYVKFSSGHAANLGAESIAAVMWAPAGVDTSQTSVTLRFDGMSYNRLPRMVAVDNIGSLAESNSTMLIVNRIGGDFRSFGSSIGSFIGNLYDDAENAYSFTATGNCQFRALMSNNFPRTFVRFSEVIPPGRTGWMRFATVEDRALLGAVINYNSKATANSGAFNQGHNLHKLTLTDAATITMPVFIPSCR